MSWPEVSLGEICKPKQHKTIPKSELLDEGFVVYGANGPIGYYSDFTHDRTTIAVTCRGATCGTINVVPPRSYITGNAMALDDLDEGRVDLRFLRYALEHQGFDAVINGAAQPQITRAPLLKYTLPLPPLDEQKRIASILDQADAVRRLRQRALDRLDALGQAIFHEMFGASAKAQRVPLGDIIDVRSSLADPKLPKNRDLPHVGPEHIFSGSGRISWERVVSCQEDGVTSGKYVFEDGDVIYSKIRPYLDKVAIADRKGMCSADMYALNCKKEHSLPSFVHFALGTSEFLSYAAQSSGRANIPKINRKQLLGYPIPLPSLDAQREFESKIRNLEDFRMIAERHSRRTDSLFASLQSRAFRGEL